jgi:hypothetical protein
MQLYVEALRNYDNMFRGRLGVQCTRVKSLISSGFQSVLFSATLPEHVTKFGHD